MEAVEVVSKTRMGRVAGGLERELSAILRELKDPRIGFVSITGVEVSPDLRHARVFVSVLGGPETEAATMEGLRRSQGYIRGEVTRRLRLRLAPELEWVPDHSIERGVRIAKLIRDVREAEERAHEGKEAVARVLRAARSFLIAVHVRPDGDAVGSALALGLALERAGRRVRFLVDGGIPRNLAWLPGADRFEPPAALDEAPEAAVLLDCGDLERVGQVRPLLDQAQEVVNIDHHPSNTRFGSTRWLEPSAAAVGEQVLDLLDELGLELDERVATALFASIASDTGGFRYANTRAETLERAARLVRAGAKPAEISRRLWEERPLSSLRLLSRTLESLEVAAGGAYAWVRVPRAALEAAGAAEEEVEGLVNYPRTLQGVEVAALFQEASLEGRPAVRVSLRSNRWLDVARVAARFGGGGHARAAGCTVPGALDEVVRRVGQAVEEELAAGPESGGEEA
ncbi:MAG: 30S ribosome-binding factor RbfA [Bacillota bacterium]|nr:30S ribosome-binding factor RbfA [Bacillota bacterium]